MFLIEATTDNCDALCKYGLTLIMLDSFKGALKVPSSVLIFCPYLLFQFVRTPTRPSKRSCSTSSPSWAVTALENWSCVASSPCFGTTTSRPISSRPSAASATTFTAPPLASRATTSTSTARSSPQATSSSPSPTSPPGRRARATPSAFGSDSRAGTPLPRRGSNPSSRYCRSRTEKASLCECTQFYFFFGGSLIWKQVGREPQTAREDGGRRR